MKENKIEIILNAAEEIMCTMETPNRDMTVDMIAKKAGIGKGSIYYYFESKDEIIDAVIERSYSSAIREYFAVTDNCINTFEKLKLLFASMIRKDFLDNSRNVITSLHVQGDIMLYYKMMMMAIKTVSPILTQILKDGVKDGSLHTETPEESAEMIVAMLTFLLNRSFFPSDDESMYRKLKLYAKVLETCLATEKDSFSFLFTRPE
ncbi:MAG: TetR/AcrR family transcriptional regulator [Ruminococcus sp.]|nr:TetR/AcrR family transcriptional regulator [Ruminococcus sp.]